MIAVAAAETGSFLMPRIPVGDVIETAFDWINTNLQPLWDAITTLLLTVTGGLADLLNTPDALVMAVVFALIAWSLRNWKMGLVALVGMLLIIGFRQWEYAMETLALVLVATVIALAIGLPIGIAAARWDRVSAVVRPVMDLMQTMPAFVWLIPVVTLFSIGVPGGVIATVIFCLPPGVRLTELGIRGVDSEIVEAGHAFGSSPGQILRGIQIPLALPTIMAGINQVIMLALSMAVIAGLVGAGGLGGQVTTSISRLDIGLGFEAGLSVVILAVFLDRATAAIGQRSESKKAASPFRRIGRAFFANTAAS